MRILFYYPDKERAVSLSSLMIAFKQQGHDVYLLTQSEEGDLHADVKERGIKVFTFVLQKTGSLSFYGKHISHLASFTRSHRIDIVYSHVQRANFVSCIAQYFSPSRFILCRHHSDCAFVDNNRKEKMMDKVINLLGKEFIVPSDKVLHQMTQVEKVPGKKIRLIRYAYDFDGYAKQEIAVVERIRKQYPAKLLLVKAARLIAEKRHLLLLQVMRRLVERNFDIKLLLLSDGPERENIAGYIQKHNLQEHVFMVGYRRDIMNYISASDLIVHVSESEASSNFAKEVGLMKKPLLVCHNVGDFDEYLLHGINALVIDKTNTEGPLEDALVAVYEKKLNIDKLGENLYNVVIARFSIQNLLREYDQINTK